MRLMPEKNTDSIPVTDHQMTFFDMQQDIVQRGLPASSEEAVRKQYLQPGVEAADLTAGNDFVRFYIATTRPRLIEQSIMDSILRPLARGAFSGSGGIVHKVSWISKVYVCS